MQLRHTHAQRTIIINKKILVQSGIFDSFLTCSWLHMLSSFFWIYICFVCPFSGFFSIRVFHIQSECELVTLTFGKKIDLPHHWTIVLVQQMTSTVLSFLLSIRHLFATGQHVWTLLIPILFVFLNYSKASVHGFHSCNKSSCCIDFSANWNGSCWFVNKGTLWESTFQSTSWTPYLCFPKLKNIS